MGMNSHETVIEAARAGLHLRIVNGEVHYLGDLDRLPPGVMTALKERDEGVRLYLEAEAAYCETIEVLATAWDNARDSQPDCWLNDQELLDRIGEALREGNALGTLEAVDTWLAAWEVRLGAAGSATSVQEEALQDLVPPGERP